MSSTSRMNPNGIQHEFICIDEGFGTLLHIDERESSKEWRMSHEPFRGARLDFTDAMIRLLCAQDVSGAAVLADFDYFDDRAALSAEFQLDQES